MSKSQKRFAGIKVVFALTLVSLTPAGLLAQSTSPVVVMTSYPDEMVSRFEQAFEQQFPQYDMQVLWRQSADALAWVSEPGNAAVDVYWSPSPRNFALMKQRGLLQTLVHSHTDLPKTLGPSFISDADGFYAASELAAYGFVINPEALAAAGLPTPQSWEDLADPMFAGQLSLPAPRVGFAPVMIDTVLQSYGWDRGWALWSEITANADLARRGASFIEDELASGNNAVGVVIDFFAMSAIAGGAPLDFVYPEQNGVNPAHVAVFAQAANAQGAQAFAGFVLSAAGQQIMLHPDIRKLPVDPAVYPAGSHNPFVLAAAGGYQFDVALGQQRVALVEELFEQTLAQHKEVLTELWQRVHAAEAAGRDVSSIRQQLGAPLITEAGAKQWLALFAGTADDYPQRDQQIAQLQQQWHAAAMQRYQQLAEALDTHLTAQQSRQAFTQPFAGLTPEQRQLFSDGRQIFQRSWVVAPSSDTDFDGLGPLHNRLACQSCHLNNGRGRAPDSNNERMLAMALRLSVPGTGAHGEPLPHPVYGDQLNEEAVPGVPVEGRGVMNWSERDFVFPDGEQVSLRFPQPAIRDAAYGDPGIIQLSARVGPALVAPGLLEAVPSDYLLALAAQPKPDGVTGIANLVFDIESGSVRVGRFGFKASVASLRMQAAQAMHTDLSITSMLLPHENCTAAQSLCINAAVAVRDDPEVTDAQLDALSFYLQHLAAPARRQRDDADVMRGESLFREAGCSVCHRDSLPVELSSLGERQIAPYTDLLLHDMGPGLAIEVSEFLATGRHWRTAPLWGIGLTAVVGEGEQYLHDGRARTLTEAILWHDGEAATARERFVSLPAGQREQLLAFLRSL
jgi:CxxC motif-containing protein (DUF1111 family)/ABC-type Fe3+ transport system substrate-binding protein